MWPSDSNDLPSSSAARLDGYVAVGQCAQRHREAGQEVGHDGVGMARRHVDVAPQQVARHVAPPPLHEARDVHAVAEALGAREVAPLATEAREPEHGGQGLPRVRVADGWLDHAPHEVDVLPRAAEVPAGVAAHARGRPRLDAQHVAPAHLQEVVAAHQGDDGGTSPAVVLVQWARAPRRGEGVARRALAEAAEPRGGELAPCAAALVQHVALPLRGEHDHELGAVAEPAAERAVRAVREHALPLWGGLLPPRLGGVALDVAPHYQVAHVHLLVDSESERQLRVHVLASRLSGGGIPFGPPAGTPCKAGEHGWAGQRPRRHRERDVGGARDGVRGLPAGGPKGIGGVLGGVTGSLARCCSGPRRRSSSPRGCGRTSPGRPTPWRTGSSAS